MATYSTDLTTRTTAESGTWVELTGQISAGVALSAAGGPGLDGENFIQGTDCYSQTTGKANGFEISMAFDYGSNLTFTTDHVVLAWLFYAVGVNMQTSANNGWNFVICDSLTTGDYFTIGGSDSGRNPYGGWFNVAIDPTATSTGVFQAGANSGNYRYFGHALNTINEIAKGTPSAIDAIRTGRGEISVTGTGSSFAEIAEYNDWNSTATPPGTSSTVLDSGYHRLGLFQGQGGTYLWKGLMSMGVTATSVTFTDSNETIIIDDSPFSYLDFNKIEINHASSVISWTNITFISTGTTAPGSFEMIDNATVDLTGCAFNGMGTFIFLSNATVSSTFNSCSLITTGGATFTNSIFNTPTGTVGVTTSSPANAALISNCTFASNGAGNGLEITGTVADITLTNVDFTDYSTTVDADKAIYVNIATGSMTITISGGLGVSLSSHIRTAGATVTVNSDTTVTFTNMKDNTEVRVYKTSDDSVVGGIENATAGTTDARTFAWAAPAATDVYYVLHNWNALEPFYQTIRVEGYIVPGSDTSIAIQQQIDRNAQ